MFYCLRKIPLFFAILIVISGTINNSHAETKSSHYAFHNIILIGKDTQHKRMLLWLNKIARVKKGKETLLNILQSKHTLTIKHSYSARLSAGKTIAPMTDNLINGIGDSVTIIFDANMPEEGTHKVFNPIFKLIEFSASQNLFHELAHAMHQMQGTWRYYDSEGQAIEEENMFRMQIAALESTKAEQRYGKSGIAIGSSEEKKVIAFQIGRSAL